MPAWSLKKVAFDTDSSLHRPTAAAPSFQVKTGLATCIGTESESIIQVKNSRVTCTALVLVSTCTATAGATCTATAHESMSAVVLSLYLADPAGIMAKHYDSIAAPEGRGKPTSGSTAA